MSKLRILHLEDNASDAFFVRKALENSGVDADITHVANSGDFLSALDRQDSDAILIDNGVPGFDGRQALRVARERCPRAPVIIVSGSANARQAEESLAAGAAGYVLKSSLWELGSALERARAGAGQKQSIEHLERRTRGMARLVEAVQALSLARDLESIMAIVRRAARELTGADGASFVLRDGELCHYADEDAISPLWKGQRFPMSACISGWTMQHRQPAVIEDIYADSRIPADAYRPTFVKSLVMVPIRTEAPIGAIGNYWARPHRAGAEEVELLQALANTTSVAMENVQLYAGLERRVKDRTVQLEDANRELEAFSYSVSHDLWAPLRAITSYTHFLREKDALDTEARTFLDIIQSEAGRMGELIDNMLRLAKFARAELQCEVLNLSELALDLTDWLQAADPDRRSVFRVQPGLEAHGDPGLIRAALENLLANAWKYTARRAHAVIELGAEPQPGGGQVFYVRDNGAGFDMQYADKLFAPFQRLHRADEFPGTGIGLATVQRIIHRHGGRIWADAKPDRGATFYFTLPAPDDRSQAS
jgi:signal transduction histidine kinase/DNA-binding NarL/FixJ family response regulator